MSLGWIVALELVAVLGVVIGLAAWELWRLRQERSQDGERREPPGR